MIVLDTNVLSELVSPSPDRRVVSWVDGLSVLTAISVVTQHELMFGAAIAPNMGERRRLARAVPALLSFYPTVLAIREEDARFAAEARAAAQEAGHTVDIADALIAGTCLRRGARIATRNTKHFVPLGVPVINPWDIATA